MNNLWSIALLQSNNIYLRHIDNTIMSRGYFIWPSLSLLAWLGWRLRAGLTLSLLDGWEPSQLTRRLTGWQLRRRLAAELGRAARHSTALDVLPMRFHDNWPPSLAVFNVSWKILFDGQDDLSADAGFVAGVVAADAVMVDCFSISEKQPVIANEYFWPLSTKFRASTMMRTPKINAVRC